MINTLSDQPYCENHFLCVCIRVSTDFPSATDVVEKCEICKRQSKSKSKPAVAIPKATEFNTIITIDLKIVGERYILWMVDACTRFIQGRVLSYKNPLIIIRALHRGWCLPYGYPTVGFWCDNGGEFRNSKMEEFVNK